MHVARLPRRLWYRWEGGAEIEYPTDIPTPQPEIKCDEVQVPVPPSLPAQFAFHGIRTNGEVVHPPSAFNVMWSWSQPYLVPMFSGNRVSYRMVGSDQLGRLREVYDTSPSYHVFNTVFITPGNTDKPRRDLLVGSDRLINPTVNTPCPKWRFTGGNCPEGSIDCGNCCLDCAAVKAGIEGLTTSVMPYSTWRKP